jgi:hypothetical protein
MKIALLTLAALLIGAANAEVLVTFEKPERYTDIGRRSPERLKDLEEFFKKLGAEYLPADQTLRIEVLDVDLAGEPRYGTASSFDDTRVLQGRIDHPSVRLRYVLESGGKEIDRREETIADRNYLERPIKQPESLAYEKRMLDAWFRKRFKAPVKGKP